MKKNHFSQTKTSPFFGLLLLLLSSYGHATEDKKTYIDLTINEIDYEKNNKNIITEEEEKLDLVNFMNSLRKSDISQKNLDERIKQTAKELKKKIYETKKTDLLLLSYFGLDESINQIKINYRCNNSDLQMIKEHIHKISDLITTSDEYKNVSNISHLTSKISLLCYEIITNNKENNKSFSPVTKQLAAYMLFFICKESSKKGMTKKRKIEAFSFIEEKKNTAKLTLKIATNSLEKIESLGKTNQIELDQFIKMCKDHITKQRNKILKNYHKVSEELKKLKN